MNSEFFGHLSGGLVVLCVIPYAIRVYQNKIHPNLTSWILWVIIGLTLFLTYKSSGAGANIWPAVFGFTNPLLITIIAIRRQGKLERPNNLEIICFVFCLVSLGLWWQVHQNKDLAQYALYLAIIADACAAIPTINFVWSQPYGDRPFAWGFFGFAYGLSVFAITEYTFANFVLPTYMFFGSMLVTFPLAKYRWKNHIPLKEWI